MPSFDTPKPITATISFDAGTLRIVAGDRADTVVDVRPSGAAQDKDVRAADRTRVEFANGRLLVKGPKERSLFGKGPSIDVEIALPAGSEVHATAAMAHFTAEGRLGDCEFRTSGGDVQVERAAGVRLNTGYGEVSVGRADGPADLHTGSGEIRVGEVKGTASAKNSNGNTSLGDVEGDITVKASNGSVTVDRAGADVSVKTANGPIRVGELARGEAVLETATGKIEIGIPEGTAAWLDVRTKSGNVHQSLEASDGSDAPGEPSDRLKVRARTSWGDIVIRRA
ncbi:DUF4097 family beta strand repeat-containing protein [Streptomyces sp. NPDC093510]|uniref:DUF4097 family beta strand repeat-containing protein n=1 Tax=Streptomyces sp. NPDC093510 TaxID=3155199 RepID=UPI00343B122B